MSLHMLNCPSHMVGKMSKQEILHKTRMNSASTITKNPVTGSLFCQPRAVGIIGGVSADVSLNFVKKLVKYSSDGKEDENALPFVLCSDPIINKNILRHDDSSQLNDHTQIVENLIHKRVYLEKSGVRCIVMPCHISHLWYDEVSKGCSVPVLHMGECVAKELKEARLKPIEAGSPLRIGVIATNAILKEGFYQDELQKEGFEIVLPDKATMEHTIIPSIEAISRKDLEGARNLLRIALQVLLVKAVNTIILASDDMRELLPHDDPLLKKCVDPLDSLARTTVKLVQSTIKCS